jgi:hypothetical protein
LAETKHDFEEQALPQGDAPYTSLLSHRWAAAGLCLLVGFVGTVTGLVYAWGLTFDRVWFWAWFIMAVILALLACREWYIRERDRLDDAEVSEDESTNVVSRAGHELGEPPGERDFGVVTDVRY